MLPAAARLRRAPEFALAVRRGRRVSRPHLVVHMFVPLPNSAEVTAARAGLVVSRAVGGAVIRNRVKRRLRHLLATRLDTLPAGSLVVVRALPGAGEASSLALAADLDAAWERVLL